MKLDGTVPRRLRRKGGLAPLITTTGLASGFCRCAETHTDSVSCCITSPMLGLPEEGTLFGEQAVMA